MRRQEVGNGNAVFDHELLVAGVVSVLEALVTASMYLSWFVRLLWCHV